MKIQSLSVCVPTGKCVNNCCFCVSRMHNEDYPNMMENQNPYRDLFYRDYVNRLAFARDNGCNTVMLTGTAEPQQNMAFLQEFGVMNQNLKNPFRWIEIQTTGVLLKRNNLRLLRNFVGVSTISLSISSFSSQLNQKYNGTPQSLAVDIPAFCELVKEYGFNLRLSLNLTNSFELLGVDSFFDEIKKLNPDQVTFRKLFAQDGTPQGQWVKENACSEVFLKNIEEVVRSGTFLGVLEFGSEQFDFNGVSYVCDKDCMSKEAKDTYKYLILRPNARLYSRWDSKASLVF